MAEIFIDILVIIFLYIIPLVVFVKFSRAIKLKAYLLAIISVAYGLLIFFTSTYTYNLLPFILVAACIVNIRKLHKDQDRMSLEYNEEDYSNRKYSDYKKYGFRLREFSFIRAVAFSVFFYVISLFVESLFYLLFNYLKLDLSQQEIVKDMANLPLRQFIIFIPISVVFAPVVEEFVFRYIIFEKALNKRLPIILSAIISSLIFAFIHFNLRAFPILVVIGLANCFLIHKKGFWYAVFNHSMFNLVTTVVLLIDKIP